MADTSLDFEIVVQYEKSKGHPELVFDSISKLISSFQRIDAISSKMINEDLRLSFVLENVESGSIRVKLARFLKSMDDKDVEDLNYKRIIGKALNACRKKAISLLAKPITAELVGETEKLFLAEVKNVTGEKGIQPFFPKEEFLYALEDVSTAVNSLSEGDSIYCVQGDDKIELKPATTIYQLEEEVLGVLKTQKRQERMILRIKKPDFLGHSKWEFKHENETIRANILDEDWLNRFHKKAIKVGPGDALRVIWEYKVDHERHGSVVAQDYNVVKVLEIIPGEFQEQQKLFPDE